MPSTTVRDLHRLHVRVPTLRPATPLRSQRSLQKHVGNSVGRVPGRGMGSIAGNGACRPNTTKVQPNETLGRILAGHSGRYIG